MTAAETRAVLTVSLMAALADGADDRERETFRALAASFAEVQPDLGSIYDDVLVRKVSLADAVRPLATPEARRSAYEAAVGMADADGVHSPAEGEFLRDLASALGLPATSADQFLASADAIAGAAGVTAAAASGSEPVRTVQGTVMPDAAEIDNAIVSAAVTNAALELLPESLASIAILPLQVRLVYGIGKRYGYELDQGHIKEFIATLGVGLTGQYLEQFGRRLLGGVLGSVLGGIGRAAGRQAASSGMAFATTWALGQLAKQYYAGGRSLDAARLKAAFAPLLEQGQGLMTQYAPAIQQRMQTIDLRNLPALIRQG